MSQTILHSNKWFYIWHHVCSLEIKPPIICLIIVNLEFVSLLISHHIILISPVSGWNKQMVVEQSKSFPLNNWILILLSVRKSETKEQKTEARREDQDLAEVAIKDRCLF